MNLTLDRMRAVLEEIDALTPWAKYRGKVDFYPTRFLPEGTHAVAFDSAFHPGRYVVAASPELITLFGEHGVSSRDIGPMIYHHLFTRSPQGAV